MREIAPLHEQHWFDLYGEVANTGVSIRFENEAQQLWQRWYEVSAMRVGEAGENRVAALFTDITERRQLEAELRRMNPSPPFPTSSAIPIPGRWFRWPLCRDCCVAR